MARLAPGRSAVDFCLQHPRFELALVGIVVAAGAVQILPVINRGGFRFLRLTQRADGWFSGHQFSGFLVTIDAGNSDMAAGQDELCLLVPRQGECRWLVALKIVAAVASVEIWRRRKLASMLIAVAVRAFLEFDLEQRVFALGDVALRAFQLGVFPL